MIAGCVPQAAPRHKDLADISIIGVQQIDRVVEVGLSLSLSLFSLSLISLPLFSPSLYLSHSLSLSPHREGVCEDVGVFA